MTQSFFLPGPLPGLNELLEANRYRSPKNRKGLRWNGYANMKKQHGEAVKWELLRQGIKPAKRVYFRFTWQERDRMRDPDNIAAGGRKVILDALVTAGILEDDGWKQIAGWEDRWTVVKDAPGVIVMMEAA